MEDRRERLFTGATGRVFVLLTLMAAAIKVGRYAVPPLLPTVIEDLQITPFEAGLGLTAMAVVFALGQYPSGRLSDQLTRKTLVFAAVACSLAGFAVLSVTSAYVVFLVGVVLVGLGDGLYSAPARSRLTDLYERRRGQAFSVHMMSLDVGGVVASGLATLVVAVALWQDAFPPLFAVLAVLAAAYWLADGQDVVLERVHLDVSTTARRLFFVPQLRWFIVAYSLYMFTIQGVLGFLPAFLRAERGFSPGFASGTFAVLFAVGLLVRPIAGWVSDHVPREYVSTGSLALAAVGLAVLVFAETAPVAVAGVVLLGAGQKAFSPAMQAHFMDLFPEGSRGGDYGAVRTTYFAIGSVGPAFVGYVEGQASYALAFEGLLASLGLSAVIVAWLSVRS